MVEGSRQLDGKVAIVTGAGRGIGKGIAMAYASAGASVCCAARTLADIEETVREIEKRGARGLAVQTDVTNVESVRHMVDMAADSFGGLDILVACAGDTFDRLTVEESDPDGWLATLQVNLIGVYHFAKFAIPHMRRRGAGKIITLGSGAGHRGMAGLSAQSCSKAGLWMLTRVMAQELWQYNISVNELIPGPTKTERVMELYSKGAQAPFNIESEWVKEIEDVASLALFLAVLPDKGPTAQSYSLMRRDN